MSVTEPLSGPRGLNRLPRRWRWPIKAAILAAVIFLVSYPDPRLFVRHWSRWLNPSALLEPDSPRLEPLVRQLQVLRQARPWESRADRSSPEPQDVVGPPAPPVLTDDSPQAVLRRVESFVYQRIPYAYDWETWGASDYLPTLDELLDMGREDCDGRAVLAGSLLRRLGYKAELVADFSHVWVKTEHGDTMSPGRHTAVRATSQGVEVNWGWRLVGTSLAASAYGLAVFPLARQLIVLAVIWALLLDARTRWRVAAAAGILMLDGLLLLRLGGTDWQSPQRALQIFGLAQLIAGIVLMWRPNPRRPARSELR